MCRSSEWGVMPYGWYFTSALPRALLGALPLAAAGAVLERRVRAHLAAVVMYLLVYSVLGHKEVTAGGGCGWRNALGLYGGDFFPSSSCILECAIAVVRYLDTSIKEM